MPARSAIRNTSAPATVAYVQVLLLKRYASRVGVDINALLKRLRLEPRARRAPEAHIPASQYIRLLVETDRLCGHGWFWFEFGREYTIPTHGALGQAIQSCSNPRDALPVLCRYLPIINAGALLRHEIKTDASLYLLVPHASDLTEARVRTELLLSILKSGMEKLLGEIPSLRFEFDYPAPAHADLYRFYLGAEVAFGKPASRMIIPRKYLDRKFSNANPLIKEMYLAQCEGRLREMQASADIRRLVEIALLAHHGPAPSLQDIAARLASTSRTLSRRLAAHGTTFRQIQQRARYARARRYLERTNLPLKEIAALTGFDSSSNFTRAFIRWHGKAPSALRRKRAVGR
jgi:AraC-like DNA-binding protein